MYRTITVDLWAVKKACGFNGVFETKLHIFDFLRGFLRDENFEMRIAGFSEFLDSWGAVAIRAADV